MLITAVLRIRSRIRIQILQIHVFLGLLDPDPDPLFRGMDPDLSFFERDPHMDSPEGIRVKQK
jgi:hypothetical protein